MKMRGLKFEDKEYYGSFVKFYSYAFGVKAYTHWSFVFKIGSNNSYELMCLRCMEWLRARLLFAIISEPLIYIFDAHSLNRRIGWPPQNKNPFC